MLLHSAKRFAGRLARYANIDILNTSSAEEENILGNVALSPPTEEEDILASVALPCVVTLGHLLVVKSLSSEIHFLPLIDR